jgi:hypothetical protein
MVLASNTFRKVLELPKVDWSQVSAAKCAQVVDRCVQLLQELPRVTTIEGVKKVDGAKYLYERALRETLDHLGHELSEELVQELIIEQFIA